MFATHLKRVLFFAFLGALVGGAIFALSPRVYEANVPLLIAVDAGGVRTGTSDDVSAILSTGLLGSTGTLDVDGLTVELVPTGGVDGSNAAAFLASGAVAVGIGGAITRASPDERRVLVATVLVVLATVALPFTPLAGVLGFERLPAVFFLYIAGIVLLYVASAEVVKGIFYRWVERQA